MPRGGSKPGERRGGRQKGTPNKAALKRASLIAEEAKRLEKPLAVQVLEDGMHRYISLSAQFQKGAQSEDITTFQLFYDKALALAKDLAPYQTPKLQSTTLVGDRDKPIDHTLNVRFI